MAARLKLSANAADGDLAIRASRRGGEYGAIMLIIEAGDITIDISVGSTNADADNLTGQLAAAAEQAARLTGEEDDEYSSPGDSDGYIGLDAKYGRWFAQLGRHIERVPPGQPANGYPSLEIATYELAALMVFLGRFPSAWAEGEHGPVSRDITAEVRAFLAEQATGCQLRPLPGVEYEPGDEVRYNSAAMEIVRDYGELGIWLAVAGDYSAGDMLVTDRSLVLRVYEPGQVIEYPSPDGNGEWLPCAFVRDLDDDPDSRTIVASALTARGQGSPGLAARNLTRPVSPATITAARSWVAENEWLDIEDADDIADLSDAQVITGMQRHYDGGWAAFVRDGG